MTEYLRVAAFFAFWWLIATPVIVALGLALVAALFALLSLVLGTHPVGGYY